MSDSRDWATLFRATFSVPASRVDARVWQEVFGDENPAELDSHSFLTRSELRRVVDEVNVGPGDLLVDVGCGRGGPGLLVAAQTGARLVGIDIADTAVEAARERAQRLGLADRAEFRVGTFESTGLAGGAAAAVLSVDSLLFTPSKPRALAELARVVRRGGRLIVTSWDYHHQPVGRPAQVEDHRPLLREAGFRVLSYEVTPQWRERQELAYRLLLDAVDELAAESGESPAELRRELAETAATTATMSRRFLAVAVRV